ncbi:DUF2249 domain-containing protein [Haloarchaeobius amylolyticus]|uniref:DUF2249 domain-containing protein n=1 Tax=Haloarchaeobius amylolyticus TaxID=1198296 RepID=UPI00226DCBE2|nr:DUF2249 domain-containing protein [Haloarchaeobius amylolyticus]
MAAKTDPPTLPEFIERSKAPTDAEIDRLDVADLPPPQPLTKTMERLADLDGRVLVQFNDRAPKHLYPKLNEQGFQYETEEVAGRIVTLIWRG